MFRTVRTGAGHPSGRTGPVFGDTVDGARPGSMLPDATDGVGGGARHPTRDRDGLGRCL